MEGIKSRLIEVDRELMTILTRIPGEYNPTGEAGQELKKILGNGHTEPEDNITRRALALIRYLAGDELPDVGKPYNERSEKNA
ncbi:hypothetical protein HY450_03055 [Candidatus Pacearchaeota archaeon]|nr:hypothetical protein [Candidatus Pacearchaeota archaeon]